jgi:hypothetical protein
MALRKPDFDINPSFFKVAVPISSASAKICLAGLINFPFKYRDRVDINTDANNLTGSGFYAVYCYGQDISSKHYPIELGHIIVFRDSTGGSTSQIAVSSDGNSYTRMRWGIDNWSAWRQLS